MSQSLHQIVENLDDSGLTVTLLGTLDYIVPGEWKNVTNFEEMIRVVTEEDDQELIQQVGERALELYADPEEGYQRAVSLYGKIDGLDQLAGSAALANKVGEKFSFLSFLGSLTPKADTTQALDAGLKFAGELATFCLINGLPGDSVSDFARSLTHYAKEDKMRLASWLAVDCVLPLGPDFYLKMHDGLSGMDLSSLQGNALFKAIQSYLPGSTADHKDIIEKNLESSADYLKGFVADNGISQDSLLDKVRGFVDVSDEKLDYLSAVLDMSTNYYQHTGIQTVARQVISRAYGEI